MRKSLKVIECPNCSTKFDAQKKFHYDEKSKKFSCSKCNYTFLYPSKNYAWPSILFGILGLTVIPGIITLLFYELDFESENLIFWVLLINGLGLMLLIWGIKASIDISKLKKIYPDWEIRLFNTLSKK